MRIIDADALSEDLLYNRCFYPIIVRRAIEDAPTLRNVAEVVRCGECVLRMRNDRCSRTGFYMDDHEFCSNGKRETGDEDS